MSAVKPIGWVNESGMLFPVAAYSPDTANYLDDHKRGWKHVYHEDVVTELCEELGLTSPGFFTVSGPALAAAQGFGKDMPDLPTSTQPGSQTGPEVFRPLCNCPVLAWEDCEHTRGTKP